jgi:hypothetical protein
MKDEKAGGAYINRSRNLIEENPKTVSHRQRKYKFDHITLFERF